VRCCTPLYVLLAMGAPDRPCVTRTQSQTIAHAWPRCCTLVCGCTHVCRQRPARRAHTVAPKASARYIFPVRPVPAASLCGAAGLATNVHEVRCYRRSWQFGIGWGCTPADASMSNAGGSPARQNRSRRWTDTTVTRTALSVAWMNTPAAMQPTTRFVRDTFSSRCKSASPGPRRWALWP
jgi:hypothetical protein